MSEVINLAKGNGDDHVYEEAACILSSRLKIQLFLSQRQTKHIRHRTTW